MLTAQGDDRPRVRTGADRLVRKSFQSLAGDRTASRAHCDVPDRMTAPDQSPGHEVALQFAPTRHVTGVLIDDRDAHPVDRLLSRADASPLPKPRDGGTGLRSPHC